MGKLYDLCVIGGGPAGIILVLEYLKLNPEKFVLMVEYALPGVVKNNLDDSIKIKNPINHHSPYECTNKGIGGSSLTWGGRCVMYDEIDFIQRPIIEGNCTWDLNLLYEINQYLPITAQYFECGSSIFDLNDIPNLKGNKIVQNFKEGIVTDSKIERWSMPTRFGKRYGVQLKSFENLTILEGYEAREFDPPSSNGIVQQLKIIDLKNKEVLVKAKLFVIAAGGQESTRLLLKNPSIFSRLENPPSALGKFYQGHMHGKISSIKFYGDPKNTQFGFLRDEDGVFLRQRFQFQTGFLKMKNLLNTAFWLDNPLYSDYKHKNGAMSLMYLVMLIPYIGGKLAPPAIALSITKGSAKNIQKHLLNVLKDFPMSIFKPAIIFVKRYLLKRKLPGVFLYSKNNVYALNFHSEQIPCSDNRMELEAGTENLNIYYNFTDSDVNSVITLHEELDKYLRETGCGELIYWYKKEDLPKILKEITKDGVHQIGTTRIADSFDKGVVDKNLKIFGTENVYVCSSSVFPTSGQANPTFLLGAFSVRLANYLQNL